MARAHEPAPQRAWTQRYERGIPVTDLIPMPDAGVTGTTVTSSRTQQSFQTHRSRRQNYVYSPLPVARAYR